MMLVKFTFNVWEDEIVPTLSELHGGRWPGFDGEEMVKAMLFSQAVATSTENPSSCAYLRGRCTIHT